MIANLRVICTVRWTAYRIVAFFGLIAVLDLMNLTMF
jgi:hypothetical protein